MAGRGLWVAVAAKIGGPLLREEGVGEFTRALAVFGAEFHTALRTAGEGVCGAAGSGLLPFYKALVLEGGDVGERCSPHDVSWGRYLAAGKSGSLAFGCFGTTLAERST